MIYDIFDDVFEKNEHYFRFVTCDNSFMPCSLIEVSKTRTNRLYTRPIARVKARYSVALHLGSILIIYVLYSMYKITVQKTFCPRDLRRLAIVFYRHNYLIFTPVSQNQLQPSIFA